MNYTFTPDFEVLSVDTAPFPERKALHSRWYMPAAFCCPETGGPPAGPERKEKMLFNDTERKVLIVWGCDRRDLTIKRLAYAAAFVVDPKVKRTICQTRDALIEKWEDARYSLVYYNCIKPHQESKNASI